MKRTIEDYICIAEFDSIVDSFSGHWTFLNNWDLVGLFYWYMLIPFG